MTTPRRILLKHVGNMGDHLFLITPVLETLKRRYPNCEITLVTAWGYKDSRGRWGKRNHGGFCIALMMMNPHVDHLVHWHDTLLDLEGKTCVEEGHCFSTWNRAYFDHVKDDFDLIAELDFGLKITDNPIQRMYEALQLPEETYGFYQVFLTDADRAVGCALMQHYPHPRIMLTEGIEGRSMRGWDPKKVRILERQIHDAFGVAPIWFGVAHAPRFHGRSITLRENIAYAAHADIAIGVLSGPLHFVAGTGVPTITLYGGQPLHRAAPAYFLNPHITDTTKHHITLEGPTCDEPCFLKREIPCKNLTGGEKRTALYRTWQEPGRQSDKSCVAVIPVKQVIDTLRKQFKHT